jgi:hypothetical protein
LAFTFAIVFLGIRDRVSKTKNLEWKGIEGLIRSTNPAIDIGAALVGVVALFSVSGAFPEAQPCCTFGIGMALLSSAVMLVNWYLTGAVFRHSSYSIRGDDVLLVQKPRDRLVSWGLFNIFVVLVLWVIWSLFAAFLTVGFLHL